MKIKNIIGREIIDSRGNPTVEVDVILENGIEYNSFAFGIKRLEMYTKNAEGKFISMDEVGEDF